MTTSNPTTAMTEIVERLKRLSVEEYPSDGVHAHILTYCQEWLNRNIAKRKAEADRQYDSQVAAHMNKFKDPEEAWRHSMDDDF
ncbi:hypothetical protein GEM49_08310 [Salmonella enterica]|nr:hypothetical protein [Salmonella enterica subsp. houtenae]EDI9056491.1 hypothetical protein [Salmonella enterica]HAE4736682.1 hypothetical protein [Salmonella enterica subsp. houtenae serovar 41:z4,z23:-]EEJ2992070.1 hypothetical protein [Salmonella enterica]EEM4211434.1 hypothetical protein [Salmonella enterica subsp. houtenae]